MRYITPAEFTAERAWQALDIVNMNGVTVRLHWTDAPYKWHVNDGQEAQSLGWPCVGAHKTLAGLIVARSMTAQADKGPDISEYNANVLVGNLTEAIARWVPGTVPTLRLRAAIGKSSTLRWKKRSTPVIAAPPII